jgi:hypothetical protein
VWTPQFGDSVREAIVSAIAISKGRESKENPNWLIDKDTLLLYAAGTNENPASFFPRNECDKENSVTD